MSDEEVDLEDFLVANEVLNEEEFKKIKVKFDKGYMTKSHRVCFALIVFLLTLLLLFCSF